MFLSGATLSFLSWSGFYVASPKRAQWAALDRIPARALTMRLVAGMTLFLALIPFAQTVGIERGVAIWLAVLAFVGVAFVFTVETHPKFHRILMISCAVLAPIFLIMKALG